MELAESRGRTSGRVARRSPRLPLRRFKLAGQAQRFLSAHDGINNLFHLRRGHVTAGEYRAARGVRLRCGPTSAELLPQLERRATVAFGRLSDDNLTVPW
jgi:hypothetical protein